VFINTDLQDHHSTIDLIINLIIKRIDLIPYLKLKSF